MQNNIAAERRKIGVTQAQLGAILGGVNGRTVRDWESGRHSPPLRMVVSMSQVFGCSTDYLLGLTDARLPARVG